MKKFTLLVLLLPAFPLHAQSLLDGFSAYQNTLTSSSSSSGGGTTATTEVTADDTGGSSSSSKVCSTNDQSSLPLKYVTSLIMEKNGALDIAHDPRTGEVTIQVPRMIGNCSRMIDWKVKKPTIQGQQAYAIEAVIKKPEGCSSATCDYQYAKVTNGEFQSWETKSFAPTLKGFEECLKVSGVVELKMENGKQVPKVNPAAIFPAQVKEKRSGIDKSGKLFFLSSGNTSMTTGPKYSGSFDYIDGCDHYEQAHPQRKAFLTLADEEKERLDAEAAKLKECKVDEYSKLADFIEKYENYADELGSVRDRLILEAAKKSAKAIAEGKYTDDDLKVLADFEKYVVQPKVDLAVALYEESLDMEGEPKKAKQAQLAAVLSEISALGKAPYFEHAHKVKLVNDGKFDEAEKVNSLLLTIGHHSRLGSKVENVVITPGVASDRILAGKESFAAELVTEKERYEYRTGQSTGKAQYYSQLATQMNNNIQTRTQNFNAEIQLEAQRIQQPNGFCYKYWRNTQRCIQDSLERIKELQALLAHYNKVDQERAAEYSGKAQEWGQLEEQGRRFLAGDTSSAPTTTSPTTASTTAPTSPTPRTDNGVYTFDFNQPQGPQQAQFTPQQHQYPINPYQNQNMFQQPSPYGYYQPGQMGQSNFGYQGGFQQSGYGYQPQGAYNFGWGGGMPQQQYGGYGQFGGYQQPQYAGGGYGGQQGYYGNPYQAYSSGYSVYGRTW